MAITVSIGAPTQKYWADKSLSGVLQIGSGSTGTLLTIPCASNERILLTGLNAVPSAQSGISVLFAGVVKVPTSTLQGSTTAPSIGSFKIGQLSASTTNMTLGPLELIGAAGQTLTIVKDAGATTQNITYSYKIQELVDV